MANVDINAIVSSEGPVVAVVILLADGSVIEEDLDMTPRQRNVQTRLGGEVTFLGMYHSVEEVDGVVVVIRKDAKEMGHALSKHKLQPPFRNDDIYGDALLMRSDFEGNPIPFSKAEYDMFAARTDISD